MSKQNKALKVLILNYEFPPIGGGSSPVTYELARRYVLKGHKVDVVTSGFAGLPGCEVVDGITVHRVPCLRNRPDISQTHELMSYLISAYRFLNDHLKQFSYDVCHTHFIVPTGILALALKKKYGLPYILSVHGSDVPGYNEDRFKLLHLMTPPLLRAICSNATFITPASDYLKSLLLENIDYYPDSQLIKIPNGIDVTKFAPQYKKKTIVSTGRLLPRKGFQQLIMALSGFEYGYELHICGEGPMLNQLQSLADQSKTPVVFHGWLDNCSRTYKKILGSASIFALPSSSENASVSLLEGMSSGCATITSNVTGCPETVGSSGILVSPDDNISLKNHLVHLMENDASRENYQKLARQRATDVFDWSNIVESYLELFRMTIVA